MCGCRALSLLVAAAGLAVAEPAPAAAQAVVAAHTLRVGTVLAADDLELAEDAGAADRALIDSLVGLETRRAIYTGRPVTVADLGPPTLVRRNTVVSMVYSYRGLDIRTEGRALDSGGAGEAVRVLNLASRQPVLATVTGENRVEVGQ